jgi:hypothetical protein
MGAIHAFASAAGRAPLPGSDGILPTPPAPSNTPHLRCDDLRHRLEPRHPPATSATLRPTLLPPADRLPPSAPLLQRRMSVAAARRVRWKKSHIRQQAAATPTPPDAHPPPSVEPLPPSSVAQITAAVLSAIQARLPGQDPVSCPTPYPATAPPAPVLAAGCPGHLLPAASAPPAPPPSAGLDPDAAAHPGATNAPGLLAHRCGDGAPAGLQSSLPLTSTRTNVPPTTPTPSSIGAFLDEFRDRILDDHHARHRSRSRSPPRGHRRSASSWARAPRGRPSRDHSPRSPRHRRSRSRRRSPTSDDHRRGRTRRGERDAGPIRQDPPSRRRLHRSPVEPRRPHASASPRHRSSRRSRSPRPGAADRRSATSPPAADPPAAADRGPTRAASHSSTSPSSPRRHGRRGDSPGSPSALLLRLDALVDNNPAPPADRDAPSRGCSADLLASPAPPEHSAAEHAPPSPTIHPGPDAAPPTGGAVTPSTPRSLSPVESASRSTPSPLRSAAPPIRGPASPLPASRDLSAMLRFPPAEGTR